MISLLRFCRNMRCPCGTFPVTLLWFILECVFFCGFHNGWFLLRPILTEEGYFIEQCSNHSVSSHQAVSAHHGADLLRHLGFKSETDGSFSTFHEGKKVKCVYRKVLKEVPIEEYNKINEKKQKQHAKHETETFFIPFECLGQTQNLDFIFTLVSMFQQIVCLPVGIFIDTYGNFQSRVIAMCCIAFGSLTMLFSSNVYPWLIFPALLMLGLSGILILLTDLQVANLFGSRRYTVMSLFVGSYFSGGIVIFFMKLTKASGVTLQTSFMFTTIGIVPVLISTIALLPRSRIPWPLPADYGQGRHVKYADDQPSKPRKNNRRISAGPKSRSNISEFWSIVKSKLYIFCIIWFSLLNLKIWMFDITLDVQLRHFGISEPSKYVSLYAVMLLFSLPLSPFLGIVLDWKRKNVQQNPHILQMKNIFNATCLHFVIAVLSSVTSLFPNIHVQTVSFLLVAIEKVSLHATLFAFLTHVHFPGEHFGKLAGIIFSVSGIVLILQFPLKLFIQQGASYNTFFIHIISAVMGLVSCCHPVCILYHCRTGRINNSAECSAPDRPSTVVLLEAVSRRPDEVDVSNRMNERDIGDNIEICDTVNLQITDL